MHRAIVLWLIVAAAPAFADEVLLRSGGRLSGVVVEQTADRVVIETAPGRVSLPASRIARIVSSASDLAVFEERAARLGATDVEGWLALGLWARSRGLVTRAQTAFARVLEIDPSHPVAHEALGHVPSGGRWVTREEHYAAQGLVEFEGAWVTPQERAASIRARTDAILAERALAEAQARVREAEARARAAEAEARRVEATSTGADTGSGIPLSWVYAGGYGYGGYSVSYPPHHGPRHGRPGGDRGHARPGGPSAPPPAARPTTASWR
jgi:hypothetical protein